MQGLNTIEDETVQQNLMGRSRFMGKKVPGSSTGTAMTEPRGPRKYSICDTCACAVVQGWVDSQGRKGKGYGVYRFQDKVGV